MTGFQLDPDAMREAYEKLRRLRDDLEAQRGKAIRLAEPLLNGDPDNPVAKKMRWVFQDRADLEGGVQAVLEDYLEELEDIQNAIWNTLAIYNNLDAESAAAVRGPAGELPGQVH